MFTTFIFSYAGHLFCPAQNKTKHRLQPICIPPSFYQHRNMSRCHQDNHASTTMWEPSRSTLCALRLSTVNLLSTGKGEMPRCTSSCFKIISYQHGNTYISYICKDKLRPNNLLHHDRLHSSGQPQGITSEQHAFMIFSVQITFRTYYVRVTYVPCQDSFFTFG